MSDRRKEWCKADIAACTCLPGECIGEKHKKFIDQFNTLSRYGLTTQEIFKDMEAKS